MASNEVARELVNFITKQIEKYPALKDELKWFYRDHGLLQFLDLLRIIGESEGGTYLVYDFGRLAARSMIPEAPQRPDLAIELGTRKIASLISGLKINIRKISSCRAKITVGFEKDDFFGGWAFCRFVEGWLVGTLEQARVDKISTRKISCVFNKGKFLFDDGELRAGVGKEVVFYPKTGGVPKVVEKKVRAGGFKFGRIKFGERFCVYKLRWKGPSKISLQSLLRKKGLSREQEVFSILINKLEKDVELYRKNLEQIEKFRKAFAEFLRASGTITSKRELWDAISRCAQIGIGFDRVVIFEVKQDGLAKVYHWDIDKNTLEAPPIFKIEPKSPEALALKEGREILVKMVNKTMVVSPLFLQQWFSPGYTVIPMGEPPKYDYLVWADIYKSKRPPNILEVEELSILVLTASLALAKLTSVEKLEERIEERTQTLRELTARLNKLYQEVKQSEIIKSQILSVVGHELRAPLNSILGITQLLMKGIDGPITAAQSEDLEAILKSGKHLLGLIDDLLDISRLEAKKLHIEPRLIDVAEELKEVVKLVKPQAEEKGLTFVASIPEHLEAKVDPKRIVQIVTNLCLNAVKYTNEGAIKLELKEENENLVITVDDTGPGIPRKYRQKIFEPFFQALERKGGGLGLGLAIAKHLVELHHGTIDVDDSEMGGAKFIVKIPLGNHERG